MGIPVLSVNSWKHKNCLCGKVWGKTSSVPASLFIVGKEQRVCAHAQAQIQGTIPAPQHSPQTRLACVNSSSSEGMKGFTCVPLAHPGKSSLCKLLKCPMFVGNLTALPEVSTVDSTWPQSSIWKNHPFWATYMSCPARSPPSKWRSTE